MLRNTLALAAAMLCGGCSKGTLDVGAAVAAVTQGDGVIGDFKLGDSWEDIKATAGTTYKVRDDTSKQLRNDLGDDPSEGWFVGFHIVDGKAQSIEVDIHGSNRKGNDKAVAKAALALQKHFVSKYGTASCTDQEDGYDCQWPVPASELWRTPPSDPDARQSVVFLQYRKLEKSRYARAGTR